MFKIFFGSVASIVCLVCVLGNLVSADLPKNDKRNLLIESIRSGLVRQEWTDGEKECLSQWLHTLDGVQNFTLWATWIWDSIQMPIGVLYGSKYQMGNFEECLKTPWNLRSVFKTQYCLAEVSMSDKVDEVSRHFDPYESAENYLQTFTKHGRDMSSFSWGVCAPAVCSSSSVATFLKVLFSHSHLAPMKSLNISVEYCQTEEFPEEFSIGFFVLWVVVLILILLSGISTFLHLQNYEFKLMIDVFSLKKNWNSLFITSKEDIPVMHGMRVITAVLIILVHQFMFKLASSNVINGHKAEMNLEDTSFYTNLTVIVDTFFVMAGLLFAKSLLERNENLVMSIIKRYLRLIGPIAFVAFFYKDVLIHIGSGPQWHKMVIPETQACTNGLLNSLTLWLIHPEDLDTCSPMTWSVGVDFKMSILTVVLYAIYRKNHETAFKVFTAWFTTAVLLAGGVTYWNRFPGFPWISMKDFTELRGLDYLLHSYFKIETRMGSYLVGVAAGYFMFLYKPANHRNVISKKLTTFLFLPAAALCLFPLLGAEALWFKEYNPVEMAIFGATHRVIWATGIALIILLAEYGTVEGVTAFIKRFLSASIWLPLSRLSYGLYLIHGIIVQRNIYSMKGPETEDLFCTVTVVYGTMVLGFIFSLFMYLLIEAPISNLISIVFGKTRSPTAKSSAATKEVVAEDLNCNDRLPNGKTKLT